MGGKTDDSDVSVPLCLSERLPLFLTVPMWPSIARSSRLISRRVCKGFARRPSVACVSPRVRSGSSSAGTSLEVEANGNGRSLPLENRSFENVESGTRRGEKSIKVRGAREHNLKNVDLDIPQGKLVVFTGVSGSGKSSMAFDTVFAEGQRRYIESFSAYARQMIGRVITRPDVDSVENLSPAICIDQSSKSNNPRSTVGTVTEALDYLRLAFGNAAIPHCPQCGRRVSPQTIDQMAASVLKMPPKARVYLLAPIVVGRKGTHSSTLRKLWKDGVTRLRVDGFFVRTEDMLSNSGGSKGRLEKNKKHTIEAVVDSFAMPLPDTDQDDFEDLRVRVLDSVRVALRLGEGTMKSVVREQESEGENETFSAIYSEKFGCPEHGSFGIQELSPRAFSFNSPFGACKNCNGLGYLDCFAKHLVVPDENQPVARAIAPWLTSKGDLIYQARKLHMFGVKHNLDFDRITWKELPQDIRNKILDGDESDSAWTGVMPMIESMYYSGKDHLRRRLAEYRVCQVCDVCHGTRLTCSARAARLGSFKWEDFCVGVDCLTSLQRAEKLLSELESHQLQICRLPIQEFCNRLRLLVDLGLGYLTLDRTTGSLSGGESRRIKLAGRLGSKLVGLLYVLDEPSIGLHPRDNGRLVKALKQLRDMGNTVIVVEHDEATMGEADHIVDFGPGAGEQGGRVVTQGSLQQILRKDSTRSLTVQYLSCEKELRTPSRRRSGNGHALRIRKARAFNVADVDLEIELGTLTAVTGVSGSGKSSLVGSILAPAVAATLRQRKTVRRRKRNSQFSESSESKNFDEFQSVASGNIYGCIEGTESIERLVTIDQSPIGRTPRSNPGTYSKAFDYIRSSFALTEQAREQGLTAGDFSFNKKGGRCEACEGQGFKTVSMLFLPDVTVPCRACGGKRFSEAVLLATYDGLTISDVLSLTIDEACKVFASVRPAFLRLSALQQVGLGYMRLGQPAPTLSGGEAQRVKLASELAVTRGGIQGSTLYLVDEPTTGLSFYDVHLLVDALQSLVERGNTVVVIEHNMDVVRVADRVIDMGPEGGAEGGRIVAYGTPEEVARHRSSRTAPFLQRALKRHPAR